MAQLVRLLLLLVVALAPLMMPNFLRAADNKSYEELVLSVKQDLTGFDFAAFRYAYAKSAMYNPYGSMDRSKMYAAFTEEDCEAVTREAATILDKNYTDTSAHLLSGYCFLERGRTTEGEHHRSMYQGLIRSIHDSGDGKTPETAFVVIAVREEYQLLQFLELEPVEQSLVNENGHIYDLMSVKGPEGDQQGLWFNIDIPAMWQMQQFKSDRN